jgi:hypothetical protein
MRRDNLNPLAGVADIREGGVMPYAVMFNSEAKRESFLGMKIQPDFSRLTHESD